jgi:inward rectifier potassium channel
MPAKNHNRRDLRGAQLGVAYSKVGARRFDLSDPYHLALTMRLPAFLLFVFAIYTVITTVFAALYTLQPGSLTNARPGHFGDAFFFSIETLATVGYGEMFPATTYGHTVASIEIVTGMAFTAIMTGLIFVRFSRPKARMVYSDTMVITPHNGVPTLMLRVAHGRSGTLTNMTVAIDALMPRPTTEGATYRQLASLRLTRATMPMVGLIMTVMHTIDDTSPLAGYDAAKLAADEVGFLVSIEARDPELAAVVHDIKAYRAADIRFGARFGDAVIPADDGTLIVDLTRISALDAAG